MAKMIVDIGGRGCAGALARKSNHHNSHFEAILTSALTFGFKKSSLLGEKNWFFFDFLKKQSDN